MHHKYTTKSLILKREPLDTSASYIILTKDLGLIRARAQGVRGTKSRLKGALQEFSLSTIAFVHGRSGWKITTAISERNFWNDFMNQKESPPRRPAEEAGKIMARICDSLIRLIPGEEKNLEIFTAVSKGFEALIKNGADVSAIESVILTRILHSLGLLASDQNTSEILKNFADFSPEVLSFASAYKPFIIRAINNGFKESQL